MSAPRKTYSSKDTHGDLQFTGGLKVREHQDPSNVGHQNRALAGTNTPPGRLNNPSQTDWTGGRKKHKKQTKQNKIKTPTLVCIRMYHIYYYCRNLSMKTSSPPPGVAGDGCFYCVRAAAASAAALPPLQHCKTQQVIPLVHCGPTLKRRTGCYRNVQPVHLVTLKIRC